MDEALQQAETCLESPVMPLCQGKKPKHFWLVGGCVRDIEPTLVTRRIYLKKGTLDMLVKEVKIQLDLHIKTCKSSDGGAESVFIFFAVGLFDLVTDGAPVSLIGNLAQLVTRERLLRDEFSFYGDAVSNICFCTMYPPSMELLGAGFFSPHAQQFINMAARWYNRWTNMVNSHNGAGVCRMDKPFQYGGGKYKLKVAQLAADGVMPGDNTAKAFGKFIDKSIQKLKQMWEKKENFVYEEPDLEVLRESWQVVRRAEKIYLDAFSGTHLTFKAVFMPFVTKTSNDQEESKAANKSSNAAAGEVVDQGSPKSNQQEVEVTQSVGEKSDNEKLAGADNPTGKSAEPSEGEGSTGVDNAIDTARSSELSRDDGSTNVDNATYATKSAEPSKDEGSTGEDNANDAAKLSEPSKDEGSAGVSNATDAAKSAEQSKDDGLSGAGNATDAAKLAEPSKVEGSVEANETNMDTADNPDELKPVKKSKKVVYRWEENESGEAKTEDSEEALKLYHVATGIVALCSPHIQSKALRLLEGLKSKEQKMVQLRIQEDRGRVANFQKRLKTIEKEYKPPPKQVVQPVLAAPKQVVKPVLAEDGANYDNTATSGGSSEYQSQHNNQESFRSDAVYTNPKYQQRMPHRESRHKKPKFQQTVHFGSQQNGSQQNNTYQSVSNVGNQLTGAFGPQQHGVQNYQLSANIGMESSMQNQNWPQQHGYEVQMNQYTPAVNNIQQVQQPMANTLVPQQMQWQTSQQLPAQLDYTTQTPQYMSQEVTYVPEPLEQQQQPQQQPQQQQQQPQQQLMYQQQQPYQQQQQQQPEQQQQPYQQQQQQYWIPEQYTQSSYECPTQSTVAGSTYDMQQVTPQSSQPIVDPATQATPDAQAAYYITDPNAAYWQQVQSSYQQLGTTTAQQP